MFVAVLNSLKQAGTLSKVDFYAWLKEPLIQLNSRILFAKTLELIESTSRHPAKDVFRWMRGSKSLELFLRNVVDFTGRSFWERAVREYDDKIQSKGLRPKKRARMGDNRSAIVYSPDAPGNVHNMFDDNDLDDIFGTVVKKSKGDTKVL
jgi:hypothetical protein